MRVAREQRHENFSCWQKEPTRSSDRGQQHTRRLQVNTLKILMVLLNSKGIFLGRSSRSTLTT